MANKVTSPVGGKRGCICKDGTYKKECCTGDLQAQGVGSLVEQTINVVTNTNTTRVITN